MKLIDRMERVNVNSVLLLLSGKLQCWSLQSVVASRLVRNY